MSWLSFAAGLLRDAMSSSSEPAEPVQQAPPPANIAEVTHLINRHRAEIDKNFETVAAMLNEQNKQHMNALRLQRRWNYGLAAAVIVVSIVAIAAHWQR